MVALAGLGTAVALATAFAFSPSPAPQKPPEGRSDQPTVTQAVQLPEVIQDPRASAPADAGVGSGAGGPFHRGANGEGSRPEGLASAPEGGRRQERREMLREEREKALGASLYLAQFHPPYEYQETKIELAIEGERFRAAGRQTVAEGWRALVPNLEADEDRKMLEDEEAAGALPLLREGEQIACAEVTIAERHTVPPKPFTEASLIQAMTGIARYVQDPKIKQLLRETDGIGTPATQAAIIQTLFDRAFIERRRRHVAATPVGRALIEILPEVATRPDMTALWEAAMRRIADGQMPLSQFLAGVVEQLRKLILSGRAKGALVIPADGQPDSTGRGRSRQKGHGSVQRTAHTNGWRAAHEPTRTR